MQYSNIQKVFFCFFFVGGSYIQLKEYVTFFLAVISFPLCVCYKLLFEFLLQGLSLGWATLHTSIRRSGYLK